MLPRHGATLPLRILELAPKIQNKEERIMRLGYFSLSQNLPLKMVLGCKSIKINFLSNYQSFS